jgi:hypothetical protein
MHKEFLFGTCLVTAPLSIMIFLLMFLDLYHNTAFAMPSTLGDSHIKVDSVTSGNFPYRHGLYRRYGYSNFRKRLTSPCYLEWRIRGQIYMYYRLTMEISIELAHHNEQDTVD